MKPEILNVCSKWMYGLDPYSCLCSSLSRLPFHLLRRTPSLGAASSSKTDSLKSVLTSVLGNRSSDFALPYWSSSLSRIFLCPYHYSTGGVDNCNLSYPGVCFRRTGSIFRLFSDSPLNFCSGNQELLASGKCGRNDGGEEYCLPGVNTCSEPSPRCTDIKATIDVIVKNQSDMKSPLNGISDALCAKQNAVKVTKNKLADYKMWIREPSSRNRYEQSRDMLAELRRIGMEPDQRIYNFLISYFCKYGAPVEARGIIEDMIKSGLSPNALTYDILICHFCRAKDLENAVRLYELMICESIQPRFSSNAAIIKGYFYSEQYLTAYNFVIDNNVVNRSSANKNYSLLASLHQRNGNLLVAYNILLEMIDKGLTPDNGIYSKVLRTLYLRRKDFAKILKSRFSRLVRRLSSDREG